MNYFLIEISPTKYILFDFEFGIEGDGSTPMGSQSKRETVGCLSKGNLQKIIVIVDEIEEKDRKAEFTYLKKMGNKFLTLYILPQKIRFLTKKHKESKKK